MALTDAEIAQFAKMAVKVGATAWDVATPEGKARLEAQHRTAAAAYFDQAQADIRDSGYRVTSRVKAVLWQALMAI